MALTGIGWGMLCGPLFPADPEQGRLFVFICLVVGFAAMVFGVVSHLAFLSFTLSTVVPAAVRYAQISHSIPLLTALALAALFVVPVVAHRTQHDFVVRHLEREAEAGTLLAQQVVIFQSDPVGIAVVHDWRIIKCNPRLTRLLGRSEEQLRDAPTRALFGSEPEEQRAL